MNNKEAVLFWFDEHDISGNYKNNMFIGINLIKYGEYNLLGTARNVFRRVVDIL